MIRSLGFRIPLCDFAANCFVACCLYLDHLLAIFFHLCPCPGLTNHLTADRTHCCHWNLSPVRKSDVWDLGQTVRLCLFVCCLLWDRGLVLGRGCWLLPHSLGFLVWCYILFVPVLLPPPFLLVPCFRILLLGSLRSLPLPLRIFISLSILNSVCPFSICSRMSLM